MVQIHIAQKYLGLHFAGFVGAQSSAGSLDRVRVALDSRLPRERWVLLPMRTSQGWISTFVQRGQTRGGCKVFAVESVRSDTARAEVMSLCLRLHLPRPDFLQRALQHDGDCDESASHVLWNALLQDPASEICDVPTEMVCPPHVKLSKWRAIIADGESSPERVRAPLLNAVEFGNDGPPSVPGTLPASTTPPHTGHAPDGGHAPCHIDGAAVAAPGAGAVACTECVAISPSEDQLGAMHPSEPQLSNEHADTGFARSAEPTSGGSHDSRSPGGSTSTHPGSPKASPPALCPAQALGSRPSGTAQEPTALASPPHATSVSSISHRASTATSGRMSAVSHATQASPARLRQNNGAAGGPPRKLRSLDTDILAASVVLRRAEMDAHSTRNELEAARQGANAAKRGENQAHEAYQRSRAALSLALARVEAAVRLPTRQQAALDCEAERGRRHAMCVTRLAQARAAHKAACAHLEQAASAAAIAEATRLSAAVKLADATRRARDALWRSCDPKTEPRTVEASRHSSIAAVGNGIMRRATSARNNTRRDSAEAARQPATPRPRRTRAATPTAVRPWKATTTSSTAGASLKRPDSRAVEAYEPA